jgi:hypothetical protein
MNIYIENTGLKLFNIPAIEADYRTIAEFALTFEGYKYFPDLASYANKIVDEYHQDEKIVGSLSLTELRGCLFYEQRRYRHFGEDPDGNDLCYIHALLIEIRNKIKMTNIQ